MVSWNAHKSYLRHLEQEGVPIAPTVWLSAGEAPRLAQLMSDNGWSKGFIKPQVGATARLTHRFALSEVATAEAFLADALKNESMMVQPYLGRPETQGEISLIYFDGALSHTVPKVPVTGDYRVQDDFGAQDFPVEPPPGVEAVAQHALRVAERIAGLDRPLLYGRVDLLEKRPGDWVLNELELIEPSLFLRHTSTGGRRLAQALMAKA